VELGLPSVELGLPCSCSLLAAQFECEREARANVANFGEFDWRAA